MKTRVCPKYIVNGCRYIPYQAPKIEPFAEIALWIFLQKVPSYVSSMFERVLNTPLHHLKAQTIFQAKRKVAQTKTTTKTSAMKVVFSQGAGKI